VVPEERVTDKSQRVKSMQESNWHNRIILDDKGGHVIGIEKLQWVDLIQHIMNMC